MGFSPDGVAGDVLDPHAELDGSGDISVWAVPTLGGQPRPYLEGVAEFDWSSDGSRLVYHTPGPGDPMFVRQIRAGRRRTRRSSPQRRDCTPTFRSGRPTALHLLRPGIAARCHGHLAHQPSGATAEQITHHAARVSHPVMLISRTLMYLASDGDGSGPWLYSIGCRASRAAPCERRR